MVCTAQRKETVPLVTCKEICLFCRQNGNVLNYKDRCKIWLMFEYYED